MQKTLTERIQWLVANNIEFAQERAEFKHWCLCLTEIESPAVYLEIGARNGGSLYVAAGFMPPRSTIIAIDLPGGPWGDTASESNLRRVAKRLVNENYDVHLILAKSSDPQTVEQLDSILQGRKVAAAFIDGDHSELGVKSDWTTVLALIDKRGLIGVHDIAIRSDTPEVEVGNFWNSLSKDFSTIEIIYRYGLGIAHLDANLRK